MSVKEAPESEWMQPKRCLRTQKKYKLKNDRLLREETVAARDYRARKLSAAMKEAHARARMDIALHYHEDLYLRTAMLFLHDFGSESSSRSLAIVELQKLRETSGVSIDEQMASPWGYMMTPLHRAVQGCQEAAAEVLLGAGADMHLCAHEFPDGYMEQRPKTVFEWLCEKVCMPGMYVYMHMVYHMIKVPQFMPELTKASLQYAKECIFGMMVVPNVNSICRIVADLERALALRTETIVENITPKLIYIKELVSIVLTYIE